MRSSELELFYWPHLPGRAECVRLLLEDAGIPYRDVARLPESESGGLPSVVAWLYGKGPRPTVFAPPVLRHGAVVLAQTSVICRYLAESFDLPPYDGMERLMVDQLMCTLSDLMVEVHDTHHPLGVSLYYEDQKEAALRRSAVFRSERLPKWIAYFERILDRSQAPALVGQEITYVDLALDHVVSGLNHAFGRTMLSLRADMPRIQSLCETIAERPGIAAYRASDRCVPFGQDGIFRHYPELDA